MTIQDNFHKSRRRRLATNTILNTSTTTTTTAATHLKRNRYSNEFRCNHLLAPLVSLLLLSLFEFCARQTTFAQQLEEPLPQQYQHNNILHFEVSENAPNGTYVGKIRGNDNQPPSITVPNPKAPTPESELRAAFVISYTNGDIFTNAILDREHREQYHFVAITNTPFAEIRCTITVRDVNDNAPMFLMASPNQTSVVIEVPENQIGVRRQLPLAVDFDTPMYGIKEFRITSGNTPTGMFQLVEQGAPARSTLLQSGHPLPSTAEDSAMLAAGVDNPQLMQQLAQQATVLIPSQPFMQSTVVTSSQQLQQASQAGSTQSASSLIPPTSSNVVNTVVGGTPISHSKFLIDLEVFQPPDRENQSSYQLVVEAIDGGQPPMFGRLMVTVNVLDVNDNDPVFPRKLYECHVREDAARNTPIHKVQAYDADLDLNGQISYFIKRHSSSSQPLNLINLNSSDSNEALAASRYATNSNSISGLSNNAGKQRSQQQAVQHSTLASNGKLTQRQQGSSAEFLDTAQMQDSANSHNKPRQTSYAPDQLFDIDQNKGEIYIVNELDYETDQTHELVIEARDHGKPPRSSFTTVKVIVTDVNDDPPPAALNKLVSNADDKRQGGQNQAELKSDLLLQRENQVDSNFVNFHSIGNNVANWFAQMNSTLLFGIVLFALFAVAFSVFLVKIKSRQPESDYNDTAGLTLASNGGQTKPSPNHSASNIDADAFNDSLRHRHHDHHRRSNGSFMGLNGSGGPFVLPDGKLSRYQYITDSSNLYHNPYQPQQRPRHHSSTSHHMPSDLPADHQMAASQMGSRGGTLAMRNHHHHALLSHSPSAHHSLEHHQFSGPNHTTSSLTYAHHNSRAALLHQNHHHQSSHQLSSVHQLGHNKGGTMNSVGTQHSAHMQQGSPLADTPNTTHSSGLPPNLHEVQHHGHPSMLPNLPEVHHSSQLPRTPCHNAPNGSVFAWPPQAPGSTIGCFPCGNLPSGGSMDSCGTQTNPAAAQALDRWFDLGVDSQLVYAHDWCGSYNWDYLSDWAPDCHTLMPLIEADPPSY